MIIGIVTLPKQIRLLYSEPSAIIDQDFLDANLAAYQAAYFHGQAVGYITERQLIKNDIPKDCKLLIVPHVKYVSNNTVARLKQFASQGGKILFIGKDNLAFNHDVIARDKSALEFMKNQTCIPAMHPKKLHDEAAKLVHKHKLYGAVNAGSQFGVRVQSADYKGKKLIFAANLLSKPVTIKRLNGASKKLKNLQTGNIENNLNIKLKPMQMKLYKTI